jgi:hypothetical protein
MTNRRHDREIKPRCFKNIVGLPAGHIGHLLRTGFRPFQKAESRGRDLEENVCEPGALLRRVRKTSSAFGSRFKKAFSMVSPKRRLRSEATESGFAARHKFAIKLVKQSLLQIIMLLLKLTIESKKPRRFV